MSGANGRFDLDAKRRAAAADEAAQTRWVFIFGEREFTLPPQRKWPGRAKRMLDDGDFAGLLDNLLGPDAAQFWDLDPTMGDLEDLFDAYGEWMGIGPGKASEPSSQPASTPT